MGQKNYEIVAKSHKKQIKKFQYISSEISDKKKRESEKEIIFKKIIPENFLDIKQNINESSDFRIMHTSQQYNF